MTSRKRIFFKFLNLITMIVIFSRSLAADSSKPATSPKPAHPPPSPRFIKIDGSGKSMNNADEDLTWHCVLDNNTGLLWEVKTHDGSLQDASQTYSWYMLHPQRNGGFAGYRNQGKCSLVQCNTQSYIDAINEKRLCGSTNWRLPAREELRSIVNYQVKYPGPTIDQRYFPYTRNQFYWSAVPDANDKDSAWGIGFSFGYDYAYFKSDHGYVRLVSDTKK
jgi:hypothetical protein